MNIMHNIQFHSTFFQYLMHFAVFFRCSKWHLSPIKTHNFSSSFQWPLGLFSSFSCFHTRLVRTPPGLLVIAWRELHEANGVSLLRRSSGQHSWMEHTPEAMGQPMLVKVVLWIRLHPNFFFLHIKMKWSCRGAAPFVLLSHCLSVTNSFASSTNIYEFSASDFWGCFFLGDAEFTLRVFSFVCLLPPDHLCSYLHRDFFSLQTIIL